MEKSTQIVAYFKSKYKQESTTDIQQIAYHRIKRSKKPPKPGLEPISAILARLELRGGIQRRLRRTTQPSLHEDSGHAVAPGKMPEIGKISETHKSIQRESSHPSSSSDSLGLPPHSKGKSQKLFSPKPQITSIPGASPKQRERYRVALGDEILGDFLNLDAAIELAKLNTKKTIS
jgi:hypothetical protein